MEQGKRKKKIQELEKAWEKKITLSKIASKYKNLVLTRTEIDKANESDSDEELKDFSFRVENPNKI